MIGGGDWAADRVVPDCMRAWLQGQKPLIRNPQATRPWQHVLEPLSGYLWLGARLAREGERLRGEAYNFGPAASHTHSVRALLERMRAHWPEAAWDERAPGGASDGEATLLQLNCDKAFAELGWRTVLDLETAAGMTVDWYRAYQAGQAMDRFAREQIAAYVEAAREQGLGWSDDE